MRSRWTPLAALLACLPLAAAADVAFDGSIGGGAPGVAPTRAAPGFARDFLVAYDEALPLALRHGELRGPNLFQSLDRLDLAGDERVTFQALGAGGSPLAGIERVVARITSGEPSLLEGVLRSEVPGADLFLLNPAGITFRGQGGLRQRLDLPAGLTVSTADYLQLADGTVLETGFAGASPLSAAPVAAFGFLAGGGGAVRFDQADIVAVPRGATLTAVGGDVVVTGQTAPALETNLEAPGGTVQLAAAGDGPVEVPADLSAWSVRGAPAGTLGDVVVEAFSEVIAFDPGGAAQGRIVLRGGRLVVDDSLVQAGGSLGATGAGADDPPPPPGTLAIDFEAADEIVVTDFAVVQSRGFGAAGSGGGRLSAPRIAVGEGKPGTFVGSRTSLGAADPFRVEADVLVVHRNGEIGTQAFGSAMGGDLAISAGALTVESGGTISTGTFAGSAPGGRLVIDAGRMRVEGSGVVTSENEIAANPSLGGGSGGDIEIRADTLELVGGGRVRASTNSDEDAGDVTVTAERLTLAGDDPAAETAIFSRTGTSAGDGTGTGRAGNVTVTAPVVELSGRAVLSARSTGQGNAGDLSVTADERLVLAGDASGVPDISARGIDGDAGGSVTVTAGDLEITGGGAISTATIGRAPAGRVTVTADRVTLSGADALGNRSSISSESASPSSDAGDAGVVDVVVREGDFRVSDGAQVVVRSRGAGDAGAIDIDAGSGTVFVQDGGAINATAEGTGEAGDVTITARAIELDGGSVTTEAADGTAESAGGNITFAAGDHVRAAGGSVVSARSVGTQDAGRIAIDAGRTLLVVDSEITTEATEDASDAAGGQIDVRATDLVHLVRGHVSTSVQSSGGAEDGGDVTIDPRFVVLNEGEVLARAVFGNGGNIRIVTGSFLLSGGSLVDASSDFGVDGTVVVEGPENQLKGELARLPARFLDASALLREHCAARAAGSGSFVVAGSEGVAAGPDAPLSVSMPLPAPGPGTDGAAASDPEVGRAVPLRLRAFQATCAALADAPGGAERAP